MIEGYHRTRDPMPSQTRRNVLSFISAFREANGYSPTIREIRDAVGLKSNSAVQRHLDWLFIDGLIEYVPNRIRSIVPVANLAS